MDLNDDNEIVTPPDTMTDDLFNTVPAHKESVRQNVSAASVTFSVSAVPQSSPVKASFTPSEVPPEETPERSAVPAEKLKSIEINPDFVSRKAPVFSDHHPLPSKDGGAEPPAETGETAVTSESTEEADIPTPQLISKVKIKLTDLKDTEHASFGDLLRQARELAGFSTEQVAFYTKLREFYIQSLENMNLKDLPPAVYVIAYVNSLSELYGMDEECRSFLKKKLTILPDRPDVPSKLIEELASDALVNEEENKRVRNVFIAFTAAAAILLGIIIWAVVAHIVSSGGDEPEEQPVLTAETAVSAEEPSAQAKLNVSDYEPLIMPQVPETTVLKMSSTPGVSR